jgi:hydroxyacylglutathione hydrolase
MPKKDINDISHRSRPRRRQTGSTPIDDRTVTASITSTTWRLKIANTHLLVGRYAVLVDTGPANAAAMLRSRLARAGTRPEALGAVLLTHGHADHAGGAAALAESGVPVVLGSADRAMTEAGHNPELVPTGPAARLLRRFIDPAFPAFTAAVLVDDHQDLDEFGIEGEYRVVGGHTAGSAVIVTPDVLVVGDLVRGGFLGGVIASGVANTHYFSDDPARDLGYVTALIDEHRPRTILVGHGGPLDPAAARRRIDELVARRHRPGEHR